MCAFYFLHALYMLIDSLWYQLNLSFFCKWQEIPFFVKCGEVVWSNYLNVNDLKSPFLLEMQRTSVVLSGISKEDQGRLGTQSWPHNVLRFAVGRK